MISSSCEDPYPWIETITSAWTGHRKFAEWLVYTMNPTTIVELGVDWGYSTFVFGTALQDLKKRTQHEGNVYGIDIFQGDHHAGHRQTYESVMKTIEDHELTQIYILKGFFTSVSKTWRRPIDILHIDGLHTYEAVHEDFTHWAPFLKEDGIILFHDVAIEQFGIKDFFHQVEDGFTYKYYFAHSAGLGILTKNKELMDKICATFDDVKEYSLHPLIAPK